MSKDCNQDRSKIKRYVICPPYTVLDIAPSLKKGSVFCRFLAVVIKVTFAVLTFRHALGRAFSHRKSKNLAVSSRSLLRRDPRSNKKIGFGHFREMLHQEAEKRVKKLSLEDKARIVSWREEGAPVSIIAEYLVVN